MKTYQGDRSFTVYKHTNKANGKVYIGVTMQSLKDRWKNGHGYHAMIFERAIKKYGWDGFEHEVVSEGLPRNEAFALERYLIEAYHATEPAYGYNHALGGEGGGMYNKHHTAEAKGKISAARKAMGFSKEHKQHISEAKQGVKHHLAKPVYQYSIGGELIKVWKYMNEAAKALKLNKGNISNACLGRRTTCGGFIWSYENRGERIENL